MHELGIALEVHRASRSAVAGLGAGRLTCVKVAVGDLAAVEPALLAHAWDAIVADGPDAGARLEVEWRPAHQICLWCGADAARAGGTWLRICAACGGPLRVEGGDALDLLQVTFDTDDHREAA